MHTCAGYLLWAAFTHYCAPPVADRAKLTVLHARARSSTPALRGGGELRVTEGVGLTRRAGEARRGVRRAGCLPHAVAGACSSLSTSLQSRCCRAVPRAPPPLLCGCRLPPMPQTPSTTGQETSTRASRTLAGSLATCEICPRSSRLHANRVQITSRSQGSAHSCVSSLG
eukprot:6199254-Pleurochrysis_carterae.AAC.4